jgi:phosphoribosyl 1,2-cyclic phosphodiesterase
MAGQAERTSTRYKKHMQIELIPLFSGSTGNSILVRAGRTQVLIDAGVSARALTQAAAQAGCDIRSIDALLITHEHTDHIRGAPMLAKQYGMQIFASEGTWRAMRTKFTHTKNLIPVQLPGGAFYIGNLCVEPFALSHDAAEPVGYVFYCGGCKAAVATDTGYVSRGMIRALEGVQSIVLESNHDPDMLQNGPYPYVLKKRVASRKGHLSNADCARVLAHLAQHGLTQAYLGHLSQQNNDPQLSLSVSRAALLDAGVDPDRAFQLQVAAPQCFACDTAVTLSAAALRR